MYIQIYNIMRNREGRGKGRMNNRKKEKRVGEFLLIEKKMMLYNNE